MFVLTIFQVAGEDNSTLFASSKLRPTVVSPGSFEGRPTPFIPTRPPAAQEALEKSPPSPPLALSSDFSSFSSTAFSFTPVDFSDHVEGSNNPGSSSTSTASSGFSFAYDGGGFDLLPTSPSGTGSASSSRRAGAKKSGSNPSSTPATPATFGNPPAFNFFIAEQDSSSQSSTSASSSPFQFQFQFQ